MIDKISNEELNGNSAKHVLGDAFFTWLKCQLKKYPKSRIGVSILKMEVLFNEKTNGTH